MSLAIDQKQDNPYLSYTRSKSIDRIRLENRFKSLYGFKEEEKGIKCLITTSGMTSINAVMYTIALKQPKSLFLLSDELYCDVSRSVTYIQRFFPELSAIYVDIRDHHKILEIFQKHKSKISLFHLESCSNPSGQMINWNMIKKFKHFSPRCIISVDNTWLTSAIFNPFQINAIDLVIESLSKYNSVGQCIGGMVLGRRKFMTGVNEWIRNNGIFVGADHCILFYDATQTLDNRIQMTSKLAIVTAQKLNQIDGVKVLYPLLPSHPTHSIYQKYCQLGPGVLWIHIQSDCSMDQMKKILFSSGLKTETSFGAPHSKIDPWPRLGISNDYDFKDQKEENRQGVWIRIAIGFSDQIEEIIEPVIELISTYQSQ